MTCVPNTFNAGRGITAQYPATALLCRPECNRKTGWSLCRPSKWYFPRFHVLTNSFHVISTQISIIFAVHLYRHHIFFFTVTKRSSKNLLMMDFEKAILVVPYLFWAGCCSMRPGSISISAYMASILISVKFFRLSSFALGLLPSACNRCRRFLPFYEVRWQTHASGLLIQSIELLSLDQPSQC